MKTWKRLASGLLALALLASLSCAALAAEPKKTVEESPKPAGQFSRWFSSLGINPKTPKASEEVLSRMGTAIKQSKTVGKTTVTLNAAIWNGKNLWLSFDVKSPGIPEEELPFVKQKFYKGTSRARGSGIGLAVCDEIIGLHGGAFAIGNADGGGAVVTIRLPVRA